MLFTYSVIVQLNSTDVVDVCMEQIIYLLSPKLKVPPFLPRHPVVVRDYTLINEHLKGCSYSFDLSRGPVFGICNSDKGFEEFIPIH